MPPRSTPRDLRASDADRERVSSVLSAALGDGRLTQEEFAERLHRALTARTLGDLEGLTADLAPAAEQPLRLDGGRAVLGFFGTEVRAGRWVVPPVMTAVAVAGEVLVDFTEALLQTRHVVLHAYALGGRVRLNVPSGVEVVMDGTTIIGRYRGGTAVALPAAGSDAAVIQVHAVCVAGEVLVKTPPRPRRWLPRSKARRGRISRS